MLVFFLWELRVTIPMLFACQRRTVYLVVRRYRSAIEPGIMAEKRASHVIRELVAFARTYTWLIDDTVENWDLLSKYVTQTVPPYAWRSLLWYPPRLISPLLHRQTYLVFSHNY